MIRVDNASGNIQSGAATMERRRNSVPKLVTMYAIRTAAATASVAAKPRYGRCWPMADRQRAEERDRRDDRQVHEQRVDVRHRQAASAGELHDGQGFQHRHGHGEEPQANRDGRQAILDAGLRNAAIRSGDGTRAALVRWHPAGDRLR